MSCINAKPQIAAEKYTAALLAAAAAAAVVVLTSTNGSWVT